MDVLVDDTGEYKAPRGIYMIIVVATGYFLSRHHLLYPVIVDDERCAADATFIDYLTILNDCSPR